MSVRPDSATSVLLVRKVMQQPQNGLEEQESEHDDADDGVVAADQIHGDPAYDPDSDAKGRDVHEVREDLEDAVDEPRAGEGGESDEDGAHGEEDDEG